LQIANFRLGGSVGGVDPIEAMGPGAVVVTIDEDGPYRSNAGMPSVQSLSVTGDDVPAARTPRGWVVLEETAMLHGGFVAISAGFGSPGAMRRLLPDVNALLRTLRARGD
jgi:hypothetical protein